MSSIPVLAHPHDTTADVNTMATPLTPSRFGRRAFLGVVYVAAGMIVLTWFDDLHPVLRATLPARAAAVASLGVAVQLGVLRQSPAERIMFWLGLGMAVTRVWFLGDASVERAALIVIAAIALMLPLALLLAPRRQRLPWGAATVLLCLAAGGRSILPTAPGGFVALSAFVALFWTLLSVLERHARSADEAWGIAHTDQLTGLANRRAVMLRLEEQIGRDTDEGPSCLLMVDLDRFKALNDASGHAAGDEALRLVAGALPDVVTDWSSVGRWGGEEFVLLLRGPDAVDAVDVAERVRVAIAATSPVTASVGVARLRPDDDVFSWMSRADAALYRAKAAGRNRVEIAPSDDHRVPDAR